MRAWPAIPRSPPAAPRCAARRRAIAAARDPAADGAAPGRPRRGPARATWACGPASVVTSLRRGARRAADGARSTPPWRRTASGCWCRSRCPTSTSTGRRRRRRRRRRRGRSSRASARSDAVALADVVLAPGLAVDRTGTRMGQGGGCYDRALRAGARAPPWSSCCTPTSCSTRTSRRCRAAARPAGRRRGDRRRRDRPRAQPVASAPSGRRVSTSGRWPARRPR